MERPRITKDKTWYDPEKAWWRAEVTLNDGHTYKMAATTPEALHHRKTSLVAGRCLNRPFGAVFDN
jgi:hypothetical protein